MQKPDFTITWYSVLAKNYKERKWTTTKKVVWCAREIQVSERLIMLFKRIISEGLAHYSYIFGSKLTAVVIDPRRDIDIYLKLALEHELQIKY